MDDQERSSLAAYACEALDILENCIQLYEQGKHHYYRVAAVQLRLLLCDTAFRHGQHEDISLIPALVPRLRLTPFSLKDNQNSITDLQRWLDSSTGLNTDLTIRQLIRRVCDIDGGAHVETKPLAGLPENEDTSQWIIDLGKYLLPLLSAAISD